MLWEYLKRLFAFTFLRFTWRVDGAQILAASFLPAIGSRWGFDVSDPATYAGYAAIAYVALRFLCAPFFVWRDERLETHRAREALAAPEFAIRSALSGHQAKLRQEFAREFIAYCYNLEWGFGSKKKMRQKHRRLREKALEIANFDDKFCMAWQLMLEALFQRDRHLIIDGEPSEEWVARRNQFISESSILTHDIVSILHGAHTYFTPQRFPYIQSLLDTAREKRR